MQSSGSGHAEVTPDVAAAAEVQLLHGSRAGLEAVVRVLSGDAARYAVAMRGGAWGGAEEEREGLKIRHQHNKKRNRKSGSHQIIFGK